MKLAKLANDLKAQLSDLTEAAKRSGIAQPKADSEVTESQAAAIKTILAGNEPAMPQGEPIGVYSGLLLQLVEQVARERLAIARMRPQIEQMLNAAVAQYKVTGGTLPPNPGLHPWVLALAEVEGEPSFSDEFGSLDNLPVLDLEAWANDPAGALMPSAELLIEPAKEEIKP